MQELKTLYDELWRDAKTMIRDMKESISMYLLSGVLLLAYNAVTLTAALGGSLQILAGSSNIISYINAFFGIFGTLLFTLLGLRFMRWYFKLKKRYAKLLEMEKAIED